MASKPTAAAASATADDQSTVTRDISAAHVSNKQGSPTEDRASLLKNLGLCTRCGLVRTHVPQPSTLSNSDESSGALPFSSLLKPITDDGSAVYKGYHVPCFGGGLDAVLEHLGEDVDRRGPNAYVPLPSVVDPGEESGKASPGRSESLSSVYSTVDQIQHEWLTKRHNDCDDGDDRKLPAFYDKLLVFQAAPLVYVSITEDGRQETPIPMLDFAREREVLTSSFRDAKERLGRAEIDLVFESATSERLSAVLAARDAQALHFTCHGEPQFLCLEDGRGSAHLLMNDDLRELMAEAAPSGDGDSRGHNIEFVFVSACYSRAAGEAFVNAGVRHVVCSQQDEPIMDQAAIAFARTLYLSLACGSSVRDAFNLAIRCVQISPDVPDAANAVKAFLLLPEDADHCVQVFSNRPQGRFSSDPSIRSYDSTLYSSTSSSSTWILPPPPQDIVGRELDMYKIIREMNAGRRLVKLKGDTGAGKASVAAAVAHYVSTRSRSLLVDEVIWLPLISGGRNDKMITLSLQELFAILLEKERLAFQLTRDSRYKEVMGKIFTYFHQKRALVIIETTTQFLVQENLDKLTVFLGQFFRGTMWTRVLLICREGLDVKLRHCMQSEVVVDSLNFGDTATLFGRICPHVSERRDPKVRTPRQLENLLVPKNKASVKIADVANQLTKRLREIFIRIGGGNAADIHKAAMNMTAKDYHHLISLAERVELSVDCKTRVELEEQRAELSEDLQVTIREQNYKKAITIQSALDELEYHSERLPSLHELRQTANTLRREIELAVAAKDFAVAEALSKELDGVTLTITAEEKALDELSSKPNNSHVAEFSRKDASLTTRAGLEVEIQNKREELESAVATRDFSSCRTTQGIIDDLESRRKDLPTLTELSRMIASLSTEIDAAFAAKDYASAETKYTKMQTLEEQVAREKASKDRFFSVAAVQVGTQLVSLGGELGSVIDEGDIERAKEIEQRIREEIQQLESKFTLNYGLEEDIANGVESAAPETLPSEDRRSGAYAIPGLSSVDFTTGRPSVRLREKLETDKTQVTTLNTMDQEANAQNTASPGAYAVQGPGSVDFTTQRPRRSQQPSSIDFGSTATDGQSHPPSSNDVGSKPIGVEIERVQQSQEETAPRQEAGTADSLPQTSLVDASDSIDDERSRIQHDTANDDLSANGVAEWADGVAEWADVSYVAAPPPSTTADASTVPTDRNNADSTEESPPMSSPISGTAGPAVASAYAVNSSTEEETIRRIVQDVMSEDAVQAIEVGPDDQVAETSNSSRRRTRARKKNFLKFLGKAISEFGNHKA